MGSASSVVERPVFGPVTHGNEHDSLCEKRVRGEMSRHLGRWFESDALPHMSGSL